MMEEWRRIEGSDNAFVSNYGAVMRNGKPVRLCKDSEGYVRCTVGGSVGRKRVHVLVANAFLEERTGCTEIDHKNNDKSDNRVCNLQRVTRRENALLAGKDGLLSNPTRRRRILARSVDGKKVRVFETQAEAARFLRCNNSEVNKALRGKRNTCHGYQFFYLD